MYRKDGTVYDSHVASEPNKMTTELVIMLLVSPIDTPGRSHLKDNSN